ncbi:hypothetical protein ACC736_37995, partial [Rhizobium ruizarguesonis]
KTSQSGLGQFLFLDGTKLAVGWGSSVVIDKYVLMTTAWPTGSAAGAGHALLNAMQSVATDTERKPHMIHIPHNM